MCGNMYCASVYGGLVSLLSNVDAGALRGRRIGVFSYGSGLASSFFSMRVVGDTAPFSEKVDLHRRLQARRTVPPEVYDEVSLNSPKEPLAFFKGLFCTGGSDRAQLQMCALREKAHLQKSYTPQGSPDTLFAGTYYLTGIDDMFRRTYEIKA